MNRRHQYVYFLLLATGMVLLGAISWPTWATPPTISSIDFPSHLEINAKASGLITYQDPEHDVAYARFDVVDGRYARMQVSASAQNEMSFALSCTPFAQQVALAVTLVDATGEHSSPVKLTLTCGQPPLYDFDTQQYNVLPVRQQLPLNFFIFDDGETALADGATFFGQAMLGEPRSEVRQAIQKEILPKLVGIWDQCGLGFDLVGVWVVRLDRVLAERLFQNDSSGLAIHHNRATGDLLRKTTFALWQAAQAGEPRAAQAFNVLIVGTRILTLWEGKLIEIEGFSEGGWPNYAVVRWGAVLQGTTPKQMLSTLAHELGHNLGLGHPGEDGLMDTSADPLNLMKGSGVTPQPRAHLLASQCQRVDHTLAQLQLGARLAASTAAPANPPIPHASEAIVRWLSLCPEGVCSGQVELRVAAEGFPDLKSFSFALFEFSRDGEHFVEIGIDRTCQDGFRTVWDTTKLPNGTYTLRATVTDAHRVKASVQIQVSVRNE